MTDFKAIFSKGQSLDITNEESFRILEEKDGQYIASYKNKIYNIVIEDFCSDTKSYSMLVNDKPVSLSLKNPLDQLIQELGLQSKKEENVSQVHAPMPGLVIKLLKNEGDTVEKGDSLLILEAMKMENVIKSAGAGTIKSISVSVNDKVEKGQLMVEFEAG